LPSPLGRRSSLRRRPLGKPGRRETSTDWPPTRGPSPPSWLPGFLIQPRVRNGCRKRTSLASASAVIPDFPCASRSIQVPRSADVDLDRLSLGYYHGAQGQDRTGLRALRTALRGERRRAIGREDTVCRDAVTCVGIAISLFLIVLPVAAQDTGVQRVWLSFQETAQLGDLLFGSGVAEVATTSSGVTSA
jgi:hypothetical protein